jgi:hypothetical protein
MAKRTRGTKRPGQRHSDRRAPARPLPRPVIRAAEGPSEQAETGASEAQAQFVPTASASVSQASLGRQQDRGKAIELDRSTKARAQGLLATRAAEEYGYVVRDVRRIIRVGGLMAAVLAVLFVLIDVIKVIKV